ncbi:transposase [Desulfosarcina sp. OttesenSCG-928-B08]|nr:transposase [Desulfosarcina sp. OttesenSCG-928-B08]
MNEKCTKIPKTLAPDTSKAMYKHNIRRKQLPLFSMPFGEHLSPDNKWVKLAELVPWDEIEDLYMEKFSRQGSGPSPITARMAFCALIIKEELRLAGRACVEQITENPYLQYFCGLDHFITEAPFDASMFVYFRKRFSMNVAAQINERIFEKM